MALNVCIIIPMCRIWSCDFDDYNGVLEFCSNSTGSNCIDYSTLNCSADESVRRCNQICIESNFDSVLKQQRSCSMGIRDFCVSYAISQLNLSIRNIIVVLSYNTAGSCFTKTDYNSLN